MRKQEQLTIQSERELLELEERERDIRELEVSVLHIYCVYLLIYLYIVHKCTEADLMLIWMVQTKLEVGAHTGVKRSNQTVNICMI